MDQPEKIRKLLTNTFELELFKAALDNLGHAGNKLRFNNFAYAIRELSRHFLHRLAPEENVKECTWFKPETDDGSLSRTQRIKYAIQGGIADDDLRKFGLDVTDISQKIRHIKSTIQTLSKYTHINEDGFDMPENEVQQLSQGVLKAFATLVEMIDDCRSELNSKLDEHIEDHMVDTIMSNAYVNIDSLAPHYSLEYGEVENYHITEINDQQIIVRVTGNIHVTLEYGSRQERREGDGLDVEQSFPYQTEMRYPIEDFPTGEPEVEEFDVDTSSWYEEGYWDDEMPEQ